MKPLVGFLVFVAACGAEHGGRSDPIASASLPFEQSLANELSFRSQDFATKNGLKFQDDSRDAGRFLTLRSNEVRIEATVRDNRLEVVGLGPVTPQSVSLVNEYIAEAGDVH